jgi:hypothetical protein
VAAPSGCTTDNGGVPLVVAANSLLAVQYTNPLQVSPGDALTTVEFHS